MGQQQKPLQGLQRERVWRRVPALRCRFGQVRDVAFKRSQVNLSRMSPGPKEMGGGKGQGPGSGGRLALLHPHEIDPGCWAGDPHSQPRKQVLPWGGGPQSAARLAGPFSEDAGCSRGLLLEAGGLHERNKTGSSCGRRGGVGCF